MLFKVIADGEHVGGIERGNRSLKEGTIYEIHKYPYKWYPREMIKGCCIKVTIEKNNLLLNDGLSNIHRPGTLVKGTT